MKALIQSFLLLMMVVLIRSTSMGMGYPQDMFAEHVTVKQTSATVHKAKSKKTIKPAGQKATSASQSACSTSHAKSNKTACPKIKKNTAQPGMAKSTPVTATVQRTEVVAVKTFNTEEDNVEETVVPLEDFLKSASTAPLISYFIQMIWDEITL